MSLLANATRRKGDPRILRSGPGSLGAADRLARAIGWFSIGLGVVQMLAPRRVTRALGLRGQEGLVRAYGAREVASGMLALSVDPSVGLRSRIIGDAVDAATLMAALRPGNPKRDNVLLALAMVAGVAALDILADRALQARHGREQARAPRRTLPQAPPRAGDRSGFPQGLAQARGAARDFVVPHDFRRSF
ncbi:hypothetical protein [Falsiroseomonas sp.]|uniref:hypothetical protein n=1 Tax=Falsiroseomonas sp. TaxID=2870721 RepID=UPI002728AE7B|nr:hypothetical protein [Falsiroseomonas sp.]MDO9502814.1 hypothetical protein [Falsiroseomonas sp.]MDP3417393.1 hypothetical protein [Falsiroseomonas sp.]